MPISCKGWKGLKGLYVFCHEITNLITGSCGMDVVSRWVLPDPCALVEGWLLCVKRNSEDSSDSPHVQACEWTVRLVDKAHFSVCGSVLILLFRGPSWKVFKESPPTSSELTWLSFSSIPLALC
jgi:hypothetical protein